MVYSTEVALGAARSKVRFIPPCSTLGDWNDVVDLSCSDGALGTTDAAQIAVTLKDSKTYPRPCTGVFRFSH